MLRRFIAALMSTALSVPAVAQILPPTPTPTPTGCVTDAATGNLNCPAGLTSATWRAGVAPTTAGLVGASNYSPAWTSISGNIDQFRLVTGDYPIALEFLGGASNIYTTLMVGMVVPSSANAGPSGGGTAEQVIAGYGQTNSPTAGVAGVSGIGFIAVPNTSAWGLVGNVSNFAGPTATPGLGGGATIYAAEHDANVIQKAGSLAPDVTVLGEHVVLDAFTDVASGSLEAAINMAAINLSFPWDIGINSPAAGTKVFANIGAMHLGASQASQPIIWNSTSSGSANQQASMLEDASGNVVVSLNGVTDTFDVEGVIDSNTSGPTTGTYSVGTGFVPVIDGHVGGAILEINRGAFTTVQVDGFVNMPGLATSGTANASVCEDSSGNIFLKTTTGACK